MLSMSHPVAETAAYDESCRHCGGVHVAGAVETYCPMAAEEYRRATAVVDVLAEMMAGRR